MATLNVCNVTGFGTQGASKGAPATPSAVKQVANRMRNGSYRTKKIERRLQSRAATARYKYEAGVQGLGEPQLPLAFVFVCFFLFCLFFFFNVKVQGTFCFSPRFSAGATFRASQRFKCGTNDVFSLKSQRVSEYIKNIKTNRRNFVNS